MTCKENSGTQSIVVTRHPSPDRSLCAYKVEERRALEPCISLPSSHQRNVCLMYKYGEQMKDTTRDSSWPELNKSLAEKRWGHNSGLQCKCTTLYFWLSYWIATKLLESDMSIWYLHANLLSREKENLWPLKMAEVQKNRFTNYNASSSETFRLRPGFVASHSPVT